MKSCTSSTSRASDARELEYGARRVLKRAATGHVRQPLDAELRGPREEVVRVAEGDGAEQCDCPQVKFKVSGADRPATESTGYVSIPTLEP